MAELMDAAEHRAMRRITRNRLAWLAALALPCGAAGWFAYQEIKNRFGADHDLATVGGAAATSLVVLLGLGLAKLAGWLPTSGVAMTPRMQWLQVERSLRSTAKVRKWYIVLVCVSLLQAIAALAAPPMTMLPFLNVVWLFEFCFPAGWSADELSRTWHSKAVQTGFSTVMLLGLLTVAYSSYHPGFVVPALPVILLAGLLAALIRMVWLERQRLPADHRQPPTNSLREVRVGQGLTWAALAERMAVPSRTVEAVECGRYKPSAQLAMRFAEAMGTSVEALFASQDPIA